MIDPREPAAEPGKARPWVRVGALLALVTGLLVLARVTGVYKHLGTEEIRAVMAAAGWWGPLAFLGVFAVGELIHIPGLVFIAAAVIAYGRPLGAALAYVGALVSLSVCFLVVRAVGGKALGTIEWPIVRRLLAHLDDHPVRTIVVIRLVLWLTPQVNYVLALSTVRFRDYLFASAVGLVLPVVGLAFLFDRLSFLLDRIAH